MDLRKLRDKATEAFTKGKFSKAAEFLQEYCQAEPKDHQTRLRLGDAWAKSGNKDKAITAYSAAAEGFAKDGFLPKAIAASKLILELDPSQKQVQQMLAELYAKKTGGPSKAAPSRPEPVPESLSRPDAIELTPEAPDQAPMELETSAGQLDLSSELPPELRLEKTDPPKTPQPTISVEIEVEPAGAGGTASGAQAAGEFELQVEPEPPVQAPPAPMVSVPPAASAAATPAAPPGLRAKKASEPPPAPARPAASRFDELELDDKSLSLPLAPAAASAVEPRGSVLHAVEEAARVGLQARGQGAEEELLDATEELGAPSLTELPKIPLFSDLSKDAFIELFERCPLRRMNKGDKVIEQGSRGDSFYVICDGDVRVFRDDNGKRLDLALLHDGAFFGEMALLSDAPRSASVEIESADAQLLEISAQTLKALSGRYPQVAQALKKFCRQRLLSNVMNTSALFQPFSRDDRRQLVGRFRSRDSYPGEILIAEGALSDGMYVVLSGEVEVTAGGQVLATLKEGEIFGEISLLMKSPAKASVRVSKKSTLLRLPPQDFAQLISSHPQILEIVAELAEDRRQKTEAVLSGAAKMGEEGLMLV